MDLGFLEERPTTTGASFSSKTLKINDKLLSFEVWDTAGQERFRALTKMFYKDTSAAIIVYDITREETFYEAEHYWIQQINEFAPKNVIKAIVANKNDLIEKEVVTEEIGRKFANEIGALFNLTSAKNKYGVEAVFYSIGYKYLDPNWTYNEETSKIIEKQTQNHCQSESQQNSVKHNKEIKLDSESQNNLNKKGCC